MKFFKDFIQKKSNIWNLTDEIIQIKDIVEDVIPDFPPRFDIKGSYTCMRDMALNTSAIYIKAEDIEKFKDIKMVYDREKDYVNLSILKNYILYKDAYCMIANKAVPQAVNIKLLYYCNIMDINLYVQKTFRLQQDATLFRELLNAENIKEKHKLNEIRNKHN